MTDLGWSIFLAIFAATCGVLYVGRRILRGRVRHARSDQDGGSIFVDKQVMEGAYWVFTPVARGFARAGISANSVTAFSLLSGLCAGLAVANGWLGLGASLAAAAALADLLDGMVARESGVSSAVGEVFDAVADRYGEFAIGAGLVWHFRNDDPLLALSLLTILGGFVFSYSTAKSEALGVIPPRGSMRRAERAVYLIAGCWLTPICTALFPRSPSTTVQNAPLVAAMSLVGVFANVSAIRRLIAVARTLAVRRAEARRQSKAAVDVQLPLTDLSADGRGSARG